MGGQLIMTEHESTLRCVIPDGIVTFTSEPDILNRHFSCLFISFNPLMSRNEVLLMQQSHIPSYTW